MVADEVDDHQPLFAGLHAQAASELLEEHDRRVGRPQHEDGVESGQVDAFVEEVDREDDVEIAGIEPLESTTTIGAARTAMNGDGAHVMLVEERRHELRMRDRATERKRPRPSVLAPNVEFLLSSVDRLDRARESFWIKAPVSPRHMSEVRHVALRPVLEPAELASRDALDEPALEDEVVPAQCQEVGTVHPLRSSSEAEQERWPEMLDDASIRGRRRVMELVDHDQFEMVRAPARQGASERLHRCEHDIRVRRPFVPREESCIAPGHDFPKDVPTLAENLFTVCNEQHAMGASFPRVECGEPCLAQARRQYDKPSSTALGHSRCDRFERLHLDRSWSNTSCRFRPFF